MCAVGLHMLQEVIQPQIALHPPVCGTPAAVLPAAAISFISEIIAGKSPIKHHFAQL